jgi:hypothetical protein
MTTKNFYMRTVIGFWLGCVAWSTAQAADPKGAFTVAGVSSVLAELKATDIQSVVVEGDPRLIFKWNNTNITADLYECRGAPASCDILQFLILYDASPSDTVQAVNEFNRQYLYGKASFDKKEGLLSYSMVDGHYGITKEQLKDHFRHLVGVTGVLLKHMKTSAVVAGQVPGGEGAVMLSAPLAPQSVDTNSRWQSLPRNPR